MAVNRTTSYGLTVSLLDVDANAITLAQSAGTSATDKLSITAGSLLRDLAKGGVMVPPEWAERIEAAIGTTEAPAIVEHVEKSVGKDGESTLVQWVIDPTQIAFYKFQADNLGVSLQHQLKAHMDNAYFNGWLGQTAPEPFKILLTPEQYRDLQEMFKKDIVTGADVMDALRSVNTPWAGEGEEDLAVGSLKEA